MFAEGLRKAGFGVINAARRRLPAFKVLLDWLTTLSH